jgi:uncharacterized protein
MKYLLRSIATTIIIALASETRADPVDQPTAAFLRKDYSKELQFLLPLADQGNAAAEASVGLMYEIGQGVRRDYTEAVKWYRRAADMGDARAQANLGGMYYTSRGVPQDFGEAAKWFRRGADQGEAVAQANLGVMYARGQGVPLNYVEALKWTSIAAARGDHYALENGLFIAKNMAPAQVTEAQRLAREWKPTN